MERWLTIEDFPDYEVSDQGQIRNASGHILGQYDNGGGTIQVVMYRDRKPCARAVNRLVAVTFIGYETKEFVPMHIDGDKTNNCADNLVWKPRWFAQRMALQKNKSRPRDKRQIKINETGEVFENALECAKHIQGIEDYVISAAQAPTTTYKGLTFSFVYN